MSEPDKIIDSNNDKVANKRGIICLICIFNGLLYYWLANNYWALLIASGALGFIIGIAYWLSRDIVIYDGDDLAGCASCIVAIVIVTLTSVVSGVMVYFVLDNRFAVAIVGLLVGSAVGLSSVSLFE